MPVRPQVSYPGVYVQEVPSGVRTIVGVSTSIAVFIGRAKQGPLNDPVLCLNFSDFERVFSSNYAGSDMARSVRMFFQNGGTQCYAMRIADGATNSEVTLKSESETEVLKLKAKSPGSLGDNIRAAVTYNGQHPEGTFNLEVFRVDKNAGGVHVKADTENWQNLSLDPENPLYVKDFVNQNSELVEVEDLDAAGGAPGQGYSQSGRPVASRTQGIFRAEWRSIFHTVGLAKTGAGWTGTSSITAAGPYTGSAYKTYTFTVSGADAKTISTDDVAIDWEDNTGKSDTVNIPNTYVAGGLIEVAEGIKLAFGAGDLVGAEIFTVAVHPPTNRLRISVDGGRFVEVDFSGIDLDVAPLNTAAGARTNLAGTIQTAINDALPTGSQTIVSFEQGPDGPTGEDNEDTVMLRIASAKGDVRTEPSALDDLAGPLMLGTAQGGIEVSQYAQYRPAPTGLVFNFGANLTNLVDFAEQVQTAFRVFRIDTTDIDLANTLETSGATDRMYQDNYSLSVVGNRDGVREKLAIIADAINAEKASNINFKWSAEVWGSRLALIPGEGGDNSQGNIATSGGDGVDIGPGNLDFFTQNVRYYSLGSSGQGSFQTPAGAPASDGNAPTLSNYRDAFQKVDKEVDLFNLMILPTDKDHSAGLTASLWGPASIFCQKRRAFLLMDPPSSWTTVQKAAHNATGVNSLRVGLIKDHSAIFYPRITITENGLRKNIGASGAIAGLMARVDGSRGVWKAPAGIEADMRGLVGLEYKLSDDENGVLNKRAVNVLRVFPNGIVSWGSRTMDGDDDFASEYKYIPVRRLALFIEESLYRGMKWVVFEPNDEPLWAQIRLNVGAFMHNLFRQGAFQGQKPVDAYFVKCDKETTTQNDINLGNVNIWVGFAPLKPAEFVILYLQQMAGQIEV